MPPFLVRPATPADAPGIAHVHVTSWRETYPGRMPEDFLARATGEVARERREGFWTRHLNAGTGESSSSPSRRAKWSPSPRAARRATTPALARSCTRSTR
ncbi:hypothetical protein DAETH_31570 [Deinococcus aetherius]|uniref:Uncharacterized protein n=1 Tax=Deinococcus aetherius TaxID=200252 RepID=A0ABM8AHB1_9DEIO|nr:hypothetical protein [Deinococcus aetherius]BDP43188.1 hypothetical protein DAETH_31570 [Deinococcus aetherius]